MGLYFLTTEAVTQHTETSQSSSLCLFSLILRHSQYKSCLELAGFLHTESSLL